MEGGRDGRTEGWMPTEIDRVRFRVCVRPHLCMYIYIYIYSYIHTIYVYIGCL